MTSTTSKLLTLSLAISASLVASPARAWDEDTCSAGSEPESTAEFPDPTCANPQPLLGSDSNLRYDHSTAHWEMTYAMARCTGIGDTDARRIAASDEGTDMSSPACGSKLINNNTAGQYYLAGYACGYEVGRGDVSQSAVPAHSGVLRWAHTDRCRFATSRGNLHGHGEFFHYPYWSANGTSNNLSDLERWVFNGAQTLVDPADSTQGSGGCDMAATTQADGGAAPCSVLTVSGLTDYETGSPVCNGVAQSEWVMPRRAPTTAGSVDSDRALRMGIYLHSLGDSYSHYTCQHYSGQPEDSSGRVLVATSSTSTDHNDYNTASGQRCGTSESDAGQRRSGVNYDMCEQACSLDSHSLEWGSSDTLSYGNSTALTALRDQSVKGLRAVWDALARYRGFSARDTQQVRSFRDTVTSSFNGYYNASDRQTYASNLARSTSPMFCGCADGIYGMSINSVTGQIYCATLQSIFVTTANSSTATHVTTATLLSRTMPTVQLYAWGVYRRADGAMETRAIRTTSEWTESSPHFSVDNSTSSSNIGRITSTSSEITSSELTITRLGISARITVQTVPG